MSVSSVPILVSEPMAADFRHLSLRDALHPLYPGQARHTVDFQKNGCWVDEDTFAIAETRFSTQSHKENTPDRNIPNKPQLACR